MTKLVPPKLSPDHDQVAALNLSGEALLVGRHIRDHDSVFIMPTDLAEPIYMSTPEAELLIAALRAAIARTTETD